MTTKQFRKAWTEIAVAFETEPKNRTAHQCVLAASGLCSAFSDVTGRSILIKMNIFRTGIDAPSDYCWYLFRGVGVALRLNHPRKYDLLRATHAAFFAAMTVKEFNEVCK